MTQPPYNRIDELLAELTTVLIAPTQETYEARYSPMLEVLLGFPEDLVPSLKRQLLQDLNFFPTVHELHIAKETVLANHDRNQAFTLDDLRARPNRANYAIRSFLAGEADWPECAGPPPGSEEFEFKEQLHEERRRAGRLPSSIEVRGAGPSGG